MNYYFQVLLSIFLYFPIVIRSDHNVQKIFIINNSTIKSSVEVNQHRSLLSNMDIKIQKKAINLWIHSLSDDDYDVNKWTKKFNGQPANYFEYYAEKLSNIYKDIDAMVNFVMIGACDGTNDRTIRDKFLKYDHW